ncbi:MAG: hypothetical protein HY370_01670 [Proteobacteria bacterium]|nr:hypothetical protein [Pseudomonadota bacterium]
MGILSTVFGADSSGKNGLSVYMLNLVKNVRKEYGQHELWEIMFMAGLGGTLGLFIGTGIAAGVPSYLSDNIHKQPAAQTETLTTEERHSAPGANEGARLGALIALYAFFGHRTVKDAWQETRQHLAHGKRAATRGPN